MSNDASGSNEDKTRGLPPQPDFELLKLTSPATADQRTFLLALIGNLAFVWSNNESMFIYLIKVLLQIDEKPAIIIFSTLTSARSRVELVERLAASVINENALRKEILRLLLQFDECTKIRNEFNHCMYAIDELGSIASTQSFRIKSVGGVPVLESQKPIDVGRIKLLIHTIEKMMKFNQDVWTLLPKLQAHIVNSRTQ